MTDPKINCIIVDDSLLQRLFIGKLVDNHPDLELTQSFGNAFQAKDFIKEHPVDLIFLDVEMPIFSGFDLLDKLEKPPMVVFTSEKRHYAFQAFNYDAVDFLLKPIIFKDRFERSIQKVLLQSMLKNKTNGSGKQGNYIFIKSKLKKYKIYVDKIRYVQAMGDYVKVITYDESYEVLSTMKDFNKVLPEKQFLRVHKSYLVNLSKVANYSSKLIQLEDTEIPLSRHRKEGLKAALDAISATKIKSDLHSL